MQNSRLVVDWSTIVVKDVPWPALMGGSAARPLISVFRCLGADPGMSRVVLAMSGGVDSSVAAWLLRQQGHDVVGLFMRHGQDQPPSSPAAVPQAGEGSKTDWQSVLPRTPLPQAAQPSCRKQGCCTAADADDARRVAEMLGIPFYAVNFEQEFSRIVDYFVAEYLAGRTPNPCIVCNTWLKFGKLFDYADRLGAEHVATGHYARLLRTDDGQFALCRARDQQKDQSYVLFGIERRLLPRLMFPLGDYRKEEIRQMARQLGLRVAAKRDSQEICFVPDQDHARFILAARANGHLRRNRHRGWHRGGTSCWLREVYHRPAQGSAVGPGRASLRGPHRSRVAPRSDWRTRGACPQRSRGRRRQLAGRAFAPADFFSGRENSLPEPACRCDRAALGRRRVSRGRSTHRSTASLPVKQPYVTMAKGFWAADGSAEQFGLPPAASDRFDTSRKNGQF